MLSNDYDDCFVESDDELLLASADFCDIPSIKTAVPVPVLPHFTCTESDTTFTNTSFIRNQNYGNACNKIKLFDCYNINGIITSNLLNVFLQKARVNIQYLDISIRSATWPNRPKTFADKRMEVTELFSILLQLIKDNKLDRTDVYDGLGPILQLLRSVNVESITKLLVSSNKSSVTNSPAYQLLHGKLEWQWLYLNMLLQFDALNSKIDAIKFTEFEEQLKLLIFDLVSLSVHTFNKAHKFNGLTKTSPFLCICVQEQWLLVQLMVEELVNRSAHQISSFWFYFNKCIEYMEAGETSSYLTQEWQKKETVVPSNFIQFSVWLMSGVAKLHKYNKNGQPDDTRNRIVENCELLHVIVRKLFATTNVTEEELRIHLTLIAPVICDLWKPSIDSVVIYWECFHSKLNSSFYVPGSSLKHLPVVNLSPRAYLNQIKCRSDIIDIDLNYTSFSIFLLLLRTSLERFDTDNGLNQAKKVLGRITVKFSPAKLLALNETGIHNVTSLLITLMLPFQVADYTERIQNFLLQIGLTRLSQSIRQIAITRSHIALLLLSMQKNLNCTSYITKLLEQLNGINMQPASVQCLRLVADGFVEIFSKSTNYDKGEHLLIDRWIIEYLNASVKECDQVLECLNLIIVGVQTKLCATSNNRQSDEYENHRSVLLAIYAHILPYIKEVWSSNSGVAKIIPEFAANLCIGADCVVMQGIRFDELFKFFLDSKCADVKAIIDFLVVILSSRNVKRESIKESIVIRHWIRCCIWSDNTENLKKLTKVVVNLKEFQELYAKDAINLINANAPLVELCSAVGKSFRQMALQGRLKIIDRMHTYLLSMDEYTFAVDNLGDERFLRSAALIISHCAPIVYIRAKSMCFFNVTVSKYILTNDILMEKEPLPQRAKTIHDLWYSIITGIEKLDFCYDSHVKNLLTNFIVKLLPHFNVHSNISVAAKPLVAVTHSNSLPMVMFVFGNISSTFLPVKRSSAHRHACLILMMLIHAFAVISQHMDKFEIFLNSCLTNIFEHALLIDERAATHTVIFQLISMIFESDIYCLSMELRQIVSTCLKSVATNNLSYYSSFYFIFIQKLMQINKNVVEGILGHLEQVIESVEKLRGVKRDEKLREKFSMLTEACFNAN